MKIMFSEYARNSGNGFNSTVIGERAGVRVGAGGVGLAGMYAIVLTRQVCGALKKKGKRFRSAESLTKVSC